MLCLIVPVFRNEESLPRLLAALGQLPSQLPGPLETVFVVDGSPDRSEDILRERLPEWGVPSKLVCLSRNFGSFSAITAGLSVGEGEYYAVLSADLQEPPELIPQFVDALHKEEADIVLGYRSRRADPWLATVFSNTFWRLYRRFVAPEIPKGGVDVFGCTRRVRDELLKLSHAGTNLPALLCWLGFRRKAIAYERRPRQEGKSAWTAGKKLEYALNSVFSFTDLPIQLLFVSGAAGLLFAGLFSVIVLLAKLQGNIPIPGYAPVVLSIMFFGALNTLGLGIIGQYVRLCLRHVDHRPPFVVDSVESFGSPGARSAAGPARGERT
jgi:glycosyltransferase involved in cell wall biosynthesis